MNEQNLAVAGRLRKLRGDRTQKSIAKAVGVTPMAISLYESGKRMPRIQTMNKLAKVYNTTVDALFFGN
jgi:transcriptional regulator with XRE-family HTH domain